VQHVHNHRGSLSHGWFCSAQTPRQDSRSTALKHLQLLKPSLTLLPLIRYGKVRSRHESPEDPLRHGQRRDQERRRPQRREAYWYLSKSVFDINRAQWDTGGNLSGQQSRRYHPGYAVGRVERR